MFIFVFIYVRVATSSSSCSQERSLAAGNHHHDCYGSSPQRLGSAMLQKTRVHREAASEEGGDAIVEESAETMVENHCALIMSAVPNTGLDNDSRRVTTRLAALQEKMEKHLAMLASHEKTGRGFLPPSVRKVLGSMLHTKSDMSLKFLKNVCSLKLEAPTKAVPADKKVVIVGGGPAGLLTALEYNVKLGIPLSSIVILEMRSAYVRSNAVTVGFLQRSFYNNYKHIGLVKVVNFATEIGALKEIEDLPNANETWLERSAKVFIPLKQLETFILAVLETLRFLEMPTKTPMDKKTVGTLVHRGHGLSICKPVEGSSDSSKPYVHVSLRRILRKDLIAMQKEGRYCEDSPVPPHESAMYSFDLLVSATGGAAFDTLGNAHDSHVKADDGRFKMNSLPIVKMLHNTDLQEKCKFNLETSPRLVEQDTVISEIFANSVSSIMTHPVLPKSSKLNIGNFCHGWIKEGFEKPTFLSCPFIGKCLSNAVTIADGCYRLCEPSQYCRDSFTKNWVASFQDDAGVKQSIETKLLDEVKSNANRLLSEKVASETIQPIKEIPLQLILFRFEYSREDNIVRKVGDTESWQLREGDVERMGYWKTGTGIYTITERIRQSEAFVMALLGSGGDDYNVKKEAKMLRKQRMDTVRNEAQSYAIDMFGKTITRIVHGLGRQALPLEILQESDNGVNRTLLTCLIQNARENEFSHESSAASFVQDSSSSTFYEDLWGEIGE
jgi:hypothetical protein